MELYLEIILNLIKQQNDILIDNSKTNIKSIIESEIYILLNKIKSIIADDSLNDEECFNKIENIICLLESSGIDTGSRHDF